jgi:cellulose synthase/poly-beta-1,6-N-acetylglucosamine synthase-like glycosyltransferase
MSFATTAAVVLFVGCIALVGFAYAGYPCVVWLASRRRGPRRVPSVAAADGAWPSVTLLIAAHNEEPVIGERLRNALAMDYPTGRLEVVVATDGCTDRTTEIVEQFRDQGVRLLAFPIRRGKATVLNDSVSRVGGDVIMFSDANTFTDPAAARHLARWFADPAVGAVCGQLVLTDPATGRNADGLYWKYETFLKQCEGRLGALLGANGGIYALRRDLFAPIPADTIVDDLVIPLAARLRSGCEIVYDAEAVAREETAPGLRSEFSRRARIGAGGFQAVARLWPLLTPRHGWVPWRVTSPTRPTRCWGGCSVCTWAFTERRRWPPWSRPAGRGFGRCSSRPCSRA